MFFTTSVETKTTLSDLNDTLAKEFSDMPDINSGGCCVFASLLAQHLAHLNPKIAVLNWTQLDLDEIREEANNSLDLYDWDECGFHCHHVVVQIEYEGDIYHIDSEGVRKNPMYKYQTQSDGYLTLKEAIEFAGQGSWWNSEFDRTQIPKIRSKLVNRFDWNTVVPIW